MKVTMFGTQPYDQESFDRVGRDYGFGMVYHKSHLNADSAVLAEGSEAVCIFVNDEADAAAIARLADLGVRLIALRCAGFNNVDLRAAARFAIPVVRVPAYSPHAVAEHAVALLLTLNRKIHRAYWRTRDGNFSLHGLLGYDLWGKTAGIVGTGRIARCLIRILLGFGMRVLAYDPCPDAALAASEGFDYVPLDELYARSDVISLHCPLNDSTRYMIGDVAIAQMKPGVVLINTGRGQLIHTEALIDGLKEGRIGAAGLECLRGGGRLLLRGHVGPHHGRRRAGPAAVVPQRDRHLASGLFHARGPGQHRAHDAGQPAGVRRGPPP